MPQYTLDEARFRERRLQLKAEAMAFAQAKQDDGSLLLREDVALYYELYHLQNWLYEEEDRCAAQGSDPGDEQPPDPSDLVASQVADATRLANE